MVFIKNRQIWDMIMEKTVKTYILCHDQNEVFVGVPIKLLNKK